MYLTEKELFNQYDALNKTYKYFQKNADRIRKFRDESCMKSFTYVGCGSGFSLCQSAVASARIYLGIPAYSIPGGDLMLNFPFYDNNLKNTVIVAPSRSGSTSEVIKAVKRAKDKYNTLCISICAKQESELGELADLCIDIPWAFDESVCQTRTVTNLYAANLMLISIIADNLNLFEEIGHAIDNGEKYMRQNVDLLKHIAKERKWEKAVVLSDCELQGIGDEAAMAFKEIPQLISNYYHILDVRHGPLVVVDDSTLVIVACTPFENSYQKDLISDIKKRGAIVITVSSEAENIWGSDYNITVPYYTNYGVMGIPFIFVPQTIAYYKAIVRGINPDAPLGLVAWVKL